MKQKVPGETTATKVKDIRLIFEQIISLDRNWLVITRGVNLEKFQQKNKNK